jgi:hypothetical protein
MVAMLSVMTMVHNVDKESQEGGKQASKGKERAVKQEEGKEKYAPRASPPHRGPDLEVSLMH